MTINLRGTATGAWDVVVNNGLGATVTIPSGFTVEAGQALPVWVDLLTRSLVLWRRPSLFTVLYGNAGNVDAPSTHIRINLPRGVKIVEMPSQPFVRLTDYDGNRDVLVLVLPSVPAQSVNVAAVRFQIDALQTYTVSVWAQSPATIADLMAITDRSTRISALGVVTTTNSFTMNVQVADSDSTTNGVFAFRIGDIVPPFTPTITLIDGGATQTYLYAATVPTDSLPLNVSPRAFKPSQTSGRSLFAELKGGKEAFNDMLEASDASELAQTRLELIAALYNAGAFDANDVDNAVRFTDGAAFMHTMTKLAGKTPEVKDFAPYLQLLDGVAGGATDLYIVSAYRYDARVQALDPNWDPTLTNGEIIQRLHKRLGVGDTLTKKKGTRGVAGFDPNDKIGALGAGVEQYIMGKEPLRYAIHFENIVTATAPAQEVVISDTLDANTLDLNTFRLALVTFGDHLVSVPLGATPFAQDVDLRPTKNLIVRVSALLDPISGRLTVRYVSLDPATMQLTEDPCGGFLPPNTDGSGEGGFVFTVMPKAGLPSGTRIRNKATIVFDLNAPILTPEWLNTLDNDAPASQVNALPAMQAARTFTVTWAGADTGAGISDYSIYVSKDGGPYTLWLANTTQKSASYTAKSGGNYRFYSVAHDGAGNVEAVPTTADATTNVPNFIYLPLDVR